MMSKYGWHKMLDAVKAVKVDEHENPIFGSLWKWQEYDGVDVQVIYVRNGSQRQDGSYNHYSLRVPLEFSSVVEAHRWTHPNDRDMPLEDYISKNECRT
jgi:hypothetical protein